MESFNSIHQNYSNVFVEIIVKNYISKVCHENYGEGKHWDDYQIEQKNILYLGLSHLLSGKTIQNKTKTVISHEMVPNPQIAAVTTIAVFPLRPSDHGIHHDNNWIKNKIK